MSGMMRTYCKTMGACDTFLSEVFRGLSDEMASILLYNMRYCSRKTMLYAGAPSL